VPQFTKLSFLGMKKNPMYIRLFRVMFFINNITKIIHR
jgi:hypothetical protein